MLTFEKLDVYKVALELRALVIKATPKRGFGELRDQVERASASVVLNIAEGAGRWTLDDKARFFTIARGSAIETAAILDLLRASEAITGEEHAAGHVLATRAVAMLTRLSLRGSARSTG